MRAAAAARPPVSSMASVSRFSMGLVISTGIAIGTLFTLFVVPAVYVLLAADHHKKPEEEDGLAAVPSGD